MPITSPTAGTVLHSLTSVSGVSNERLGRHCYTISTADIEHGDASYHDLPAESEDLAEVCQDLRMRR